MKFLGGGSYLKEVSECVRGFVLNISHVIMDD